MSEDEKQLNVRIPSEVWEKLDSTGQEKKWVVTEALKLYLGRDKQPESSSELIKALQAEVTYLRSKLDDALGLLHQEQVLHLSIQKLLQGQTESQDRPWWKFWIK